MTSRSRPRAFLAGVVRVGRSKWGRRSAKIAAATIIIIVGIAVGLRFFVDSTSGRELIARQLESMVSDQIAGRMRIGHIDRVSVDHVVARDILFSSPRGDVVLRVRWANLDIRLFDLLRGHIATSRARLRGGTVYLETDPRGSLGLDQAFRARRGGSSGTTTVDFDQLHVSGIELRARMSGMPDTRVTHVSGIVRVWTRAAGAKAQLRVTRVTGHVHVASPIPIAMVLGRGTFRYDEARIERTRLDVHGTMGGSPVRLEATVELHDEERLLVAQLTVDGVGGWIRSSPLITQATLADIFSPSFDLRVQTTD